MSHHLGGGRGVVRERVGLGGGLGGVVFEWEGGSNPQFWLKFLLGDQNIGRGVQKRRRNNPQMVVHIEIGSNNGPQMMV